MPRALSFSSTVCGALLAFHGMGLSRAEEGFAFFESEIRPMLIEHCQECHATDTKQKGGLLLDSRAGWMHGGDSGPAIVPGDPSGSLLIRAVRYEDAHLEMPPKTRLSSDKIAALERWVAMGAPDPREGGAVGKVGISMEDGRRHWAYRPLSKPEPPAVDDQAWPTGAIDRFLLAKMEAAGVPPAESAVPEAALRRLYLDLTGLPPTPAEIEAFMVNPDEEAWNQAIDRLLGSPRYGEHWGRHWLDVARYGESFTLRGLIMREAWRYRDYVVTAFNEDKPFDRFIIEQIAGDLLQVEGESLRDRQQRHIATGFLALGNHNLEEQDKRQLDLDIVDEQVDTIGKAFLAQTLGCARCHDHKFDPIPTRDYHAMAGIFASTVSLSHANVSNWLDLPLPAEPEEEARLSAQETRLSALEEQLKLAEKARQKAVAADPGRSTGERPDIIAAGDLPGVVVDDSEAEKVGDWKASVHTAAYIGEGYAHDMNEGKGQKTLSFTARVPQAGRYEVRLAWAPGPGRSNAVPVMISSADGDFPMKIDISGEPPIDGRFLSLGEYRFETNGANFVMISNEGTQGYVVVDAVQFLPADQVDAKPESNVTEVDSEASRLRKAASAEVSRLKKEIAAVKAGGPERLRYLGVREAEQPSDLPVLARGLVHSPTGDPVPRGVLQVVEKDGRSDLAIPPGESGRRQFAQWVASPDHPLTARVFVNRVWHWMFGQGLCPSVDNFGTTGEAPSHPELLDWLATRFLEEGGSVKWLVREIAASRAYRLAVPEDESAYALADIDNRLFARARLRRMEAESLRDGILFASGRLELSLGGSVLRPGAANDYNYEHDTLRRSIYLPALRNSPHPMLEAFNQADPSRTTGRRDHGTVAPQALFLLNHPFVLEESRQAAARVLREASNDTSRATLATRLALGRSPLPTEQQLFESVLASTPDPAEAWATIFQGLFASLDYRYLH